MFCCVRFAALPCVLAAAFQVPSPARAEWPMVGHDAQRTSWARQDAMPPALTPVWMKKIPHYIPTKSHVIAVAGQVGRPDALFLPTCGGVYAVRPADGADLWFYRTDMPVGHSPSFADGKLYVACTDATIHCLDPATGKRLWQTARAGGAFDVSPLVADGKVLAGCRDGHFYAFDASDGKLLWSFKTGGPISYSAAYADGVVYFAGYDCHAYALQAADGKRLWKSQQLPGEGFYSFWPVVVGDRVIVPGSNYYHIVGSGMADKKLEKLTRTEAFPAGVNQGHLVGPQDKDGWMDAGQFVKYLDAHPQRKTMLVLDRATGKQTETAPILWWGNPSGNRYPPAIGPGGVAYTNTPWMYHPGFCKGRVAGWKPGAAKLFPLPSATGGLDSNDETMAYAVIGPDNIYVNHKGDQNGWVYSLKGGTLAEYSLKTLTSAWPGYYSGLTDVNYGDGPIDKSAAGTHGNVTPPVPLKSMVYFHRSNALMCFGPASSAGKPKTAPPAPAAARAASLPAPPAHTLSTVEPLQNRLAEEIAKMLQAGHLRPVYANCTEHYYAAMASWYGENLHEYWHNPADTIYTLLRALPHVPQEMKAPLRQYIQSEWNYAPPSQFTHMGFGGAQREWAIIPPELEGWFKTNSHARPGNYVTGQWTAWSFNPYNFYACWKYAQEFGLAREILADVQPKIRELPDDETLQRLPHVLNSYIAGYHGVLGLQQLAGRPKDAHIQAWLDEALKKRVALLAADPRKLSATEAGGFLFLVPELGEYLFQHAREAVARHVQMQHAIITPLWFLGRLDETTRVPRPTRFAEGSTSQFYDVSSTFNAKALALKQPKAELEKYLDNALVRRGDLFYIQNLCAVLEARESKATGN